MHASPFSSVTPISVLQTGAEAIVYKANRKLSNGTVVPVAMRVSQPLNAAINPLTVEQLKSIPRHPNVVYPLAVARNEGNVVGGKTVTYEVMELFHQDLFAFLEDRCFQNNVRPHCADDKMLSSCGLDEDVTRSFARQLLLAMQALHDAGIAHMDIKLENVLVSADGERVALCDFGLAIFGAEAMNYKHVRGSNMYMAPEVVALRHFLDTRKEKGNARSGSSKGYNAYKCDVFSFGVVVSFLLTVQGVGFERHGGKYVPTIAGADKFSERCNAFLQRAMTFDPAERATVSELLSDPWITDLSSKRRRPAKLLPFSDDASQSPTVPPPVLPVLPVLPVPATPPTSTSLSLTTTPSSPSASPLTSPLTP